MPKPWWVIPALIVVAGLIAYENSFSGLFLFDDKQWILTNPVIRQLWPPWGYLAGNSRPLVQLSLAVNYALGGSDVWGYHAVNLGVHLLAGLLLFGIVRRMLESEPMLPAYGPAAPWLAGVVAVIWTVHPLQTESVTYVIQRAESMMGLFLLATLYCGIRSASSPHPRRWQLAGVVACLLGMGTKEVMVVAPVVMLVYDRMFLASSFADILRRRSAFYLGLAACWLVLAAELAGARSEDSMSLVADLTPWNYALTQFGVIVHYLRLSFWPHPLILDYGWPLTRTIADALPWAAIVAALLALTILALRRRFWAGFWGAWFFLVLAPTSTIVPISDAAFEHRMYVPLAAVVVLAVVGSWRVLGWGLQRVGAPAPLGRWVAFAAAAATVVALTAATVRRNDDYRDDYRMWSDNVTRRPDNPRAHFDLGNVLDRQRKPLAAIAEYREALRLKPDYVDVLSNLGGVLVEQGRYEEAIPILSEAVRLKPDFVSARNNLGAALFKQRRTAEAIVQLSAAARLTPDSLTAQHNLALALAYDGQLDAAVEHFAAAVRLDPGNAKVRSDLNAVLVRQGKRQ